MPSTALSDALWLYRDKYAPEGYFGFSFRRFLVSMTYLNKSREVGLNFCEESLKVPEEFATNYFSTIFRARHDSLAW